MLRFKSEEQRNRVKQSASSLGISVNEYILKMLDGSGGRKADAVAGGVREGMQIARPVESREQEPYSDHAFEEFADSMTEPKNPCPDCGEEMVWNEKGKGKIYECKCGFIKKGRK